MTLIELISMLNISFSNLVYNEIEKNNFLQRNKKKVMPLLEEDRIVIEICNEDKDEKYGKKTNDEEFIDLELGNGYKFINEEKLFYFYNKV